MTESQYYTLITVPLVGILTNGGLVIYLGRRIDKVIEYVNDIRERVAVLASQMRRLVP